MNSIFNLKIKKFQNNKINIAVDICCEFSLYVYGWTFENLFSNPERINTIYLAYTNGVPVACLILENSFYENYHDIGVYVKPSHRKKGIGKALVARVIRDFSDKELIYSEGVRGSDVFFEKCFKKD